MIRTPFAIALILILFAYTPSWAKGKKRSANSASTSSSVTKFKRVSSCSTQAKGPHVAVIKQWHLAPRTATKGFKEKYPQERNQTAIYQALAGDVRAKRMQLIVAEGCESGQEINATFATSFNGWDFSELHKIAQTKGYEKILTHVPLKLEARYGDEIRTICGDSEGQIKEGNIRLSNLRGWLGFWTRLQQNYVDDKGKMYSDAAADLLKISRDTPTSELLKKIKERMKDDLSGFKASLNARNEIFAQTLKVQEFSQAAVVIGGLHAADLKTRLESAGLACDVYEPPGYQADDEDLIAEFEKALSNH